MQRNLEQFNKTRFDLLIVGGGICGAWIALDATLRGLSTALVDKGDFGAATSAATGRMIHGGIRYLQHLALGRLKVSLHERMLLLRNAPHLVHPVPFLIPTSGHLLKGKEILGAAMLLYDYFANRAVPGPPYAAIPPHQRLSRQETVRMEPLLGRNGLTGAVRFFDCQMPFPERLTLAVIQSAHQSGAVVANHVQAVGLITEKNAVHGVQARDCLTGQEISIQADCTVNAAGPWVFDLLREHAPAATVAPSSRQFSKGIHIITRSLTNGNALALATRHQHSGSWLDRGGRHFFIIPLEGHSLVGTTNVPFTGGPDQKMVTEEDIQGLIADVNSVYPAAGLCREDVLFFYGGLYPDEPDSPGRGYQGARNDRIVDHGPEQGLHNLLSVTCVKYTTARRLAQAVVDKVVQKHHRRAPSCSTASAVLHGGDMPGLEAFVRREQQRLAPSVPADTVALLARLYGTKMTDLLEHKAQTNAATLVSPLENLDAIQTSFAVRHEMARKLTDVLFRRTCLGLFGCPGREKLRELAGIMAEELNWDEARVDQEIAEVEACCRPAA